ncbi:hypothetical protein [Kitasatospora sp. DSM 101779]|uniref:hypothetical protein n=1 Tax=Kitasatospora sp. DSM 101779 TaxID=2853165 RepID=UPI0021D7F6B7|nr:hypothetical protein [Kitasatospora sp. DSM 101779]MCU7823958.1 hypothetical protein [Kitasatospora sp. DSM 101779]
MTWMPDRDAAPRRRRRGSSSSQSQSHQSEWRRGGVPGQPDGTGAHGLGIPRILGRRARWVGARLRREG